MSADHLASLALAFQQRMDTLADGVDPSWHARLGLDGWSAFLPDGDDKRRVAGHLFRRWCGPLPALQDLAHEAGELALLSREQLRTRLSVLALSGRPGVLRSCVERRSRQAYEAELGSCFGRLRAASTGASVASWEVAAWSPLHWAWIGYCELVRARLWPCSSLRRLARLALPAGCARMASVAAAPAARMAVKQRLAQLPTYFEEALT